MRNEAGYSSSRRGEEHHNAKLTEDKVRELRRLVEEVDICIACAAKIVGVNKGTAWDAVHYKTWKHVGEK